MCHDSPKLMLCVAVCDSVLQCIAVCCSVLQCVAVSCSVLQCAAVCCSVLQCFAACCSVLQCVAVCCSVLQCVAVCCSVLQCVAVRRDSPKLINRRTLFLHSLLQPNNLLFILTNHIHFRGVPRWNLVLLQMVRCSVLQYVAVCCG